MYYPVHLSTYWPRAQTLVIFDTDALADFEEEEAPPFFVPVECRFCFFTDDDDDDGFFVLVVPFEDVFFAAIGAKKSFKGCGEK